jgi:outer membrane autotransporter protein
MGESRLSFDTQFGGAYNITHQQRRIDYLSKTAFANYEGEHYIARFSLGYDVPVSSNLVITPQYAIRGARVIGAAYRETGAGAAGMKIARMRVDTVTQEIGVKLAGKAGFVTPDVRVAWVHEYKEAGMATLANLGGVAYTSSTGRLGQDGVAVNAGLTLQPSQNFRIRAGYSGELRGNYQRHTGSLNLSWNF